MISYGHSLATPCTYRQALQQGRTFARRAFLSFRAQSLSVVTQTLDILLELIPDYIALMRVSNQRSPFLGRDFDEGLMAVGMEACVRATKAEGAGIARMMQDPKYTRMLELIPHDVAFVRSMIDVPRELQPLLSKLFYGCNRGAGPTEGTKQLTNARLDTGIGVQAHAPLGIAERVNDFETVQFCI